MTFGQAMRSREIVAGQCGVRASACGSPLVETTKMEIQRSLCDPLRRVIVVSACLLGATCGGSHGPTAPTTATISSLAVSSPNSTIFIGATEQLTATATLSNGSTATPAGTWGSDAPAVATVSASSGLVMGVGAGEATIYFDNMGRRATKVVRVLPNYAGIWSGLYVVTSCTRSGGFMDTGFCPGGIPGKPMTIRYTFNFRQDGDVVSGSLDPSDTATADGAVSTSGTLVISARIPEPNGMDFRDDRTWQLNVSPAGDLTGTVASVITSSRLSGQTSFNGTISTSTRAAQ
jgi:Bacterial Ig-like domain (group 2)